MESTIHIPELKDVYDGSSPVVDCLNILRDSTKTPIQLRGIRGSLDSIFISTLFNNSERSFLIIANDFEEAAYLFNDLQHFVEEEKVLYFPASFKRPYQYEEIDNANVLRRSETLSRLNSDQNFLIVSYGGAIAEKVINKRSLIENTISIRIGDEVDLDKIREQLQNFGFEQTDFVYEAGQFAIRGGILDIFSFSNELPYRVELFGDEIENIRIFDPGTQLSKDSVSSIDIIPNIEQRLVKEEQKSFFHFLPENSVVAYKDYQFVEEIVGESFEKCSQEFNAIANGGRPKIVPDPKEKFLTRADFRSKTAEFQTVEFGNRFRNIPSTSIEVSSAPQPTFKKNFDILSENLRDYEEKGYSIFISSDSESQIERLRSIFNELNASMDLQTLPYSLHEGFVDHDNKLVCYTDHQIFERLYRYKLKEKYSKAQAMTLRELQSLQPGDFVTHIDYGVGRFAGLEKIDAGGKLHCRYRHGLRLLPAGG